MEESQLEGRTWRVTKLILGLFLLLLVSISGDTDPNQNFPKIQEALECCQEQMQPMLLLCISLRERGMIISSKYTLEHCSFYLFV